MDTVVYQSIEERKLKLYALRTQLKKEFIGLDEVIDEVIDLLLPWYLFPDAQLRPTVINLWGMTGSGKSALVNRLIELLEYKHLFAQMDMGEFESDSASWFKELLTDDLEFFHEQAAIICLDEFQFARTIDKDGNELGKDKLRVIWELIDSGKINYFPYQNSYNFMRAETCLNLLSKCMDKRVVIRNGVVLENLEGFQSSFENFYFESEQRYGSEIDKDYFLSKDFVEGIYYLHNDDLLTKSMVKEKIETCDNIGLEKFILEGLTKRTAVKTLDLSRTIIFILGNLDEAYYMSGDMNPDSGADELHEATKRISIADVKSALQERFRNEQIARLGNNHIIYRSFKKEDFRKLIRLKLQELGAFAAQKFKMELAFDESVVDIVYEEGVFPSQGTRPVFTTIKNLIEGSITKVVLELLQLKIEAPKVIWKFVHPHFEFQFMNALNEVVHEFSLKPVLKTHQMRTSGDLHLQAHTAVHEAGHAVVAAMAYRIIPQQIVSKTATSDMEGFCVVNNPDGPLTLGV